MNNLTRYSKTLENIAMTENSITFGLSMTEFVESPITEIARDNGMIKVTLSSPQSGIIKINASVRYTGKNNTGIIIARPVNGVGIEDEDGSIVFRSGTLEAKVSKTGPFRIVFSHCNVPITATSLNSFFNTRRSQEYTGACFDMAPGEACFGLGGSGSLDLVGRKEETDNSRESAAFNKIPFFVSSRGYGIFVNSNGSVKFDFASQSGSINFSQEGSEIEFLIFAGNLVSDVIATYTGLIGRDSTISSLNPGLALDYGENFDHTADSILAEVEKAGDLGINISEVWLGTGYLPRSTRSGYTWDPERFPDPGKFIRKLHDRGIRLGLSLTPYLSDFAPEFPECIDNGFFICDDSNEPILTDFDKGIMGIIDVTNQSARNWLGLRFDALLHTGVDMAEADFRYELFNDLNKDTAFYNSFAAIFNTLVKDCVARCIGSDNDSVIRSSTAAGDQIGPYRNIYINKNTASYSSLACAITNTLSYGMTGYGITNMDVPAITTSSPTLYTRWVQVAMTMPHFRLPVPFCKDQDMLPAIKMAGNIRLALLSYLESNCVESANYGSPVVRPMQVEFPSDRLAQKCTGQYMLGSIVMVCPVLSGAGNVTFYVPAGTWTNFLTRETVTGPRIMSRKADINEIPLYIRPNSILPSRSADSITFSCFQLAEDKVAATEVFGFDKSANGIINVLKSGERITVKTEGFGRLTKRIVLTGIKDVAGVSEGYPDSDEYGTTIEFNSNELIITLG